MPSVHRGRPAAPPGDEHGHLLLPPLVHRTTTGPVAHRCTSGGHSRAPRSRAAHDPAQESTRDPIGPVTADADGAGRGSSSAPRTRPRRPPSRARPARSPVSSHGGRVLATPGPSSTVLRCRLVPRSVHRLGRAVTTWERSGPHPVDAGQAVTCRPRDVPRQSTCRHPRCVDAPVLPLGMGTNLRVTGGDGVEWRRRRCSAVELSTCRHRERFTSPLWANRAKPWSTFGMVSFPKLPHPC